MESLIQYARGSRDEHWDEFYFRFDSSRVSWLKEHKEIVIYLGHTK